MREKDKRGFNTFALTADVKEAHRQIPIDPRDWHLLGCQLERGGDVLINTVGDIWHILWLHTTGPESPVRSLD